eukprot:scaffold7352_cov55-Phaeocystis_antarctica.AAC.2
MGKVLLPRTLPRQCRRGICHNEREYLYRGESTRAVGVLVVSEVIARCESQRRVPRARAGAVPGRWTRCAARRLKSCTVAPSRARVATSASGVRHKLPRDARKADRSRLDIGLLAARAGGATWCSPGARVFRDPLKRGV